ncbi:hypothetical protein COCMIDRAFT_4301 [Bipolaris oryzae ATCC 44560]|uniref:Ubiquitin-like domain-containing protein n=1 Tax=Bipolaris oryzae ATCC 44560 TaxID=930090 RepID=W6ZSG9_COCMI|nr:uncharacterized protein COCMIDRAFT_4301 [Bipolaris oryzae ATCC 44560]EUC46646.1 hypothetical protein COCMIDRAFT_4301 [Bipolaris oryzae ATCC 44560]
MADAEQTINLKVLSPSAELEGGITLAGLPASITVKELRSRIHDAVPSKPAPERMRLIYRGRVVANDADTLTTVFGADNLRENKDQSLHLVIRELPPTTSSPVPQSSSVPPNLFRSAVPDGPAASPLQTNPFRAIPQTRPASQPQMAQPHLPPHRLPGQVNPIPIPLPAQLHQPFARAMGDEQPSDRTSEQPDQGTQATGDRTHTPIPPGPSNLPGNGDQAIRREGIAPNGARWTVTTFNPLNIAARLPPTVVTFPVPHALAFGRPPLSSENQRLLPRVHRIFLETKREIDNVRALLQLPGASDTQSGGLLTSDLPSSLSIPAWRIERLRQHLNTVNQNLDVVDRALALLPTEPEVTALRRSATELRVDAAELSIVLDRQEGETVRSTSDTAPGAPIIAAAASTTSQARAGDAAQTVPTDAPAELFLLSSPQGPVGVLFDQQGTYTTAPMVPTLPFQTFSSQFAQNRQLIAGLGQQMAQGTNQLHNQLANMQPTPIAQPMAVGQAQGQDRGQHQNQNQNQNQNDNQDGLQPEENDRLANIAGHLWLIFKLAVFVYVFAGGGGIYRPVMLGAVAGIVYLAQIGMFEDQINYVRRHFEALLPVGAMAERAAHPINQRPRGNISPEEAARRILQQRQEQRFAWVRESLRGVERAFTLFVASLFPGVGERMVHAQEERERLARVAAREERERQEEEARKREEDARAQQQQQAEEKASEAKVETDGEATPSSSSKGKERAEEQHAEGSASAS